MLTLTSVTAGYGESTVLRDISLTVAEGEVAALLGPNGAGKTTLLRTATGLVRPRSGTIVLDAIDPVVRSANLRLTMRPAYRGRGYGTEAIQLVLGMGFDGLGLHRIGLVVPAINARAKSLYENVGFRVEGRLRDAFRDGDGWTDGLVMGLLEDEYRAGQLPVVTP